MCLCVCVCVMPLDWEVCVDEMWYVGKTFAVQYPDFISSNSVFQLHEHACLAWSILSVQNVVLLHVLCGLGTRAMYSCICIV